MTATEVDALAVPAGYRAADTRCDSVGARRINRRMAEACGRRYGWSPAQVDAATEAAALVPTEAHGRSGRIRGCEPLPVMIAAAARVTE